MQPNAAMLAAGAHSSIPGFTFNAGGKMGKAIAGFLATTLAATVASTAFAQTTLTAHLTTTQEPGPINPTTTSGAPRPLSFGDAFFLLNAAQTEMTMFLTVYNIDFTGTQTADVNDNMTAAHIHASATLVPPNTAGVVWGFFGSPFNDNNPNDFTMSIVPSIGIGGIMTAKWDLNEGNNTTLTAQIDNILSGRAYVNVHTVQFPGGEIRGALVLAPEPSTVALVATGLVGLAGVALRRRRRDHLI